MKLLHVSDLHIGKRVNGISMVEDQRYILSQMLKIMRDHSVDALLIAGDIYDKASPSAEAVTVFDAFLTDVAALGVQVLAIPGNHDSAERIAYVQGLLESQGVHFAPVYDGTLTCVNLSDEYGEVAFWLMPFLKPGDVRRFFPDAEIGDDYSAALHVALSVCDIDPTKRNVVLSHQLVTAFGTAPDRADDEIKLGGLDNVDFSVYDAFDYVALGHVHRPQRVGRDTVRYSGSPLKYSFSEARYDKSCVLVELGAKGDGTNDSAGARDAAANSSAGACVQLELIPLVPLHDMRELTLSLAEVQAAGAEMAGPASEDYVHITLTDKHPQLDAMAKVRDVYPNAMALDYEYATALVARNTAQSLINPDSMSMAEMFAAFYEAQTSTAMSDEQAQLVAKIASELEEGGAHEA